MISQPEHLGRLFAAVNPTAWLRAGLNLGQGWLGSTRPLSGPLNLDLVLTKACNLDCEFCIAYESLTGSRHLERGLLHRIAARLFSGLTGLYLCSGGEPLLYPHLREVLLLARKHRVRTTLSTNATLLTGPVRDWLVTDQTLQELIASVDGARPETLARIRRGADLDLIRTNLTNLVRLRRSRAKPFPRIKFGFAAMASNIEELPQLIRLAAELGADSVVVRYLNVPPGMDFQESLYNHPRLAARVFQEAGQAARAAGIGLRLPPPVDKPARPQRCFSPWRFCQIDPDGSIRFCYRSWRQRLGFFSEDFGSLWRGPIYAELRRRVNTEDPYFPGCAACPSRFGYAHPAAHRLAIDPAETVIPGLEEFQVDWSERSRENRRARSGRGSGRGPGRGSGRDRAGFAPDPAGGYDDPGSGG